MSERASFNELSTAGTRVAPRKLLVFLDTSRSAKPDHPGEIASVLVDDLRSIPKFRYYEVRRERAQSQRSESRACKL